MVHAAQQHRHRHGGHGHVLLAGDENELLAREWFDRGEDFQSALAQRHPVFLASLHALAGDGPDSFGKVDFIPACADDFTGP